MASLESLINSLNTAQNTAALIAALRQLKAADLGGGRLTKSGANLLLSPYRGTVLPINSALEEIPDAGVTLAPTGLIPTTTFRERTSNVATLALLAAHELIVNDWVNVTSVGGSGYNALAKVASTPTATTFTYANTGGNEGSTADTAGRIECDRYIYAHMSGGVVTLTARGRLIAHSPQAGTGIEIATADATRSLVGLARIIAGPAWGDTDAQRFVLSWAHRRGLRTRAHFTADRSTASTTTVELNTEIRVQGLTWADAMLRGSYAGGALNTGANITWTTIGLDGTATIEGSGSAQQGTSLDAIAASAPFTAVEGFHFLTLLGRVTAGTGSWSGGATLGERTNLTMEVQG